MSGMSAHQRSLVMRLVPLLTLILGLVAGYYFSHLITHKEAVEAAHFQIALGMREKAQIMTSLSGNNVDVARRITREFLQSDIAVIESYLPESPSERAAFYKVSIEDAKKAAN
jgi:hypothetical protein